MVDTLTMGPRHLLFPVLFFCISAPSTQALVTCYVCYDCPDPFTAEHDLVFTYENCTACRKRLAFSYSTLITKTRACMRNCSSLNTLEAGFGELTTCCNDRSFCNSALSRFTAAWKMLLLSISSVWISTSDLKF